jgi:WG containing repeat
MNNLNNKMNLKYQYVGFLPCSVRIKQNGFWGINDFEGNEILPSNYIEVFTLSSGYGIIAARDAGFWDLYDYHGNKLNSERYDSIYSYYGFFGMTKVKVGEKWGLINKYGRVIIPIKYKNIEKFGRGIILKGFGSELKFIERTELIKLTEIKNTPIFSEVQKTVPKRIIKLPHKKSRAI